MPQVVLNRVGVAPIVRQREATATPACDESPTSFPASISKRLATRRQRLQGQHLAPLSWANCDPAGNRRALPLRHWGGLKIIAHPKAVLGAPFRQTMAFELATCAVHLAVGQQGQFDLRRRLDPEINEVTVGSYAKHRHNA